jgi:hypothetical protein
MASAAVTSRGSPSEQAMAQQLSLSLFEAVTNKDYDTVAELYADNARRTIVSFLAMRNRWSPFVGIEKSGTWEVILCKLHVYSSTFSTQFSPF